METGPRLKVSSERLVKLGIKPVTPDLQGRRFIHYTTAAPQFLDRAFKLAKSAGADHRNLANYMFGKNNIVCMPMTYKIVVPISRYFNVCTCYFGMT